MTIASITSGTLYIVATPIGNLQDITLRAIDTLKSVELIISEDTRHSLILLKSLGIHKPLISLHAHNETEKSPKIIETLHQGVSAALISDAGTPLISDPGYLLVKLAHAQNIPVTPIPGPCALITALCAAGVPSNTFTFLGFLPAKSQARQHLLQTYLTSSQDTLIYYESTHRIVASIEDLQKLIGNDEIVLIKELTKQHERFLHANCDKIKSWLLAHDSHTKGEFVVIIPPRITTIKRAEDEVLLKTLMNELSIKQSVKIASQLSKTPKNELYSMALSIGEGSI